MVLGRIKSSFCYLVEDFRCLDGIDGWSHISVTQEVEELLQKRRCETVLTHSCPQKNINYWQLIIVGSFTLRMTEVVAQVEE